MITIGGGVVKWITFKIKWRQFLERLPTLTTEWDHPSLKRLIRRLPATLLECWKDTKGDNQYARTDYRILGTSFRTPRPDSGTPHRS